MYARINLPVIPVRASASEQSEMVTQILYGEFVNIVEQKGNWLYIEICSDHYKGWIDIRMIEKTALNQENTRIVTVPIAECVETNTGYKNYLPGGSLAYPNDEHTIVISGHNYTIPSSAFELPESTKAENIVSIAKKYLNAPYLWGGKTILGIDCAGLVQVIYKMNGIELPRDTYDQINCGKTIIGIENALPGDVAFFENERHEAIHVGIISGIRKIIHASGWVKENSIDNYGIISSSNGEYSHKLCCLKRIIEL